MTLLAPTLEAFFTERLMTQRQASPHTIAGYRDTMRLLLCFATEQTGKQPSKLDVSDLDVRLISAFLDHLENERHNTASTRNVRLAAIRSLFRFAALRHPEHADVIARVLALPAKRFDRALIAFLTKDEVNALLAAPDRGTPIGRRDHALLTVALYAFVQSWKSFLWPLVMTSRPEVRPIQVGLSTFALENGTYYHTLMAASTFTIAPVVLLFILVQRHFLESIARSGLKG